MSTYNPVSTYRLQFNSEFTLNDAQKIVDYLHRLGIKTIYASPILQAVKGSSHGYDVTNYQRINREVGLVKEFKQLIAALHDLNMGWLQDFVPNHMAFSVENPWIYDVLEKGEESEFYHYFDIFRNHPDPRLRDKLMLPFFGKPPDQLIDDGELAVSYKKSGFSLKYFDDEYPVSKSAYPALLKTTNTALPKELDAFVNNAISARGWDAKLEELYRSYRENPSVKNYIDQCLTALNNDKDQMKEWIKNLSWLPVCWDETEKIINYRRFFTINGLICINIQNDEVFDAAHQLIRQWAESSMIDGVRIDHIDGLYHPDDYLTRLRKLLGEEAYISVEKILEQRESLPEIWPVQGSTGYDFLGMVNHLLTNKKSGAQFYSFYKKWKEGAVDIRNLFHNKKRFILFNRMMGELDYLAHECISLPAVNALGTDVETMKMALAEFLVFFPVYKIYNTPTCFTDKETRLVKSVFKQAGDKNEELKQTMKVLRDLFLLKNFENEEEIDLIDHFFRRCMQFTGPLMAKGIEDTAFYAFNLFIAHNEVGDSPLYPEISRKAFHRFMQERGQRWPLTMNATATHDTKRGEDARARLNVLSDMPQKWMEKVNEWQQVNQPYKLKTEEKEVPVSNNEYFIYQTLCAHLPMNGRVDDSFVQRIEAYLIKALREAKVHSSWSEKDKEYEEKTLAFVRKILSPESDFLISYYDFMDAIIPHGMVNSITQLILKNTAPGVPDIYQGSETWNLSFVDPDNRRAVDYKMLSRNLQEVERDYNGAEASELAQKLWEQATDGKIKHFITWLTLQERLRQPELFLRGSYSPLEIKGRFQKHLIAFHRHYRDEHLVVVLPLNTGAMPAGPNWEDTRVKLPALAPYRWENRLTKEVFKTAGKLEAGELFEKVPFGLLKGIPNEPERRAGILMHVSSLPGAYGIGDFGPQAHKFIDFLNASGQRYWQILPLSVTNHLTGYSPYSSFSAFAGNTLFVNPVHLVKKGLIDDPELLKFRSEAGDKANFQHAEEAKNYFLDLAWEGFRKSDDAVLKKKLGVFREKEKYWLEDFALFVNLKKQFSQTPWNSWPQAYRDREADTLKAFGEENNEDIEKVIFNQFIFSEQWRQVKDRAFHQGVEIFGDVPIYISYDSADVWAHPELFRLNPDKSMAAVAGVPPDYFNENGQLWGMPLFNWEIMEANGFEWWLQRLRKNLEWFDLLRLDHFRGFSAFWEVPADEKTAINGKWSEGPGSKLFDVIKKEFPHMPFVAEDLGKIDQPVYDLRDRYELPGMKVVQFGFGDNMPFQHHVPSNHSFNSIAYTGTHDNNTAKGWFRNEADKATRKRFKQFTGVKLNYKNCHKEMIRTAYASSSRLTIIPMQDWLGLDEKSRMNFPATTNGNWLWRAKPGQFTARLEKQIRKWVKVFGRY